MVESPVRSNAVWALPLIVAAVAASLVFPGLAHASVAAGGSWGESEAVTAQSAKATAYKIAFKANGGKGRMPVQAAKRGAAKALNANRFTRAGYKFAGWNTKKNGKGKSYANKAKVKNLAKAGKTVTLYAQWKKSGNSASKLVYVIAKEGSYKYSYNKCGLLTKIETQEPYSTPRKTTYAYTRNMRLKKFKAVPSSGFVRKSSGTFAYDKKGRLTRIVSNGSHGSNNYIVTYKYNKKGYAVVTEENFLGGYSTTTTYKNTFDSRGRLVKQKNTESGYIKRFSYDAEGNLITAGLKNTYKNGRLIMRSSSDSSIAYGTFKYKKISVPKKYVSQVKKQQWALLNPEVSFVFPPYW